MVQVHKQDLSALPMECDALHGTVSSCFGMCHKKASLRVLSKETS